jgi:hypothetical protein
MFDFSESQKNIIKILLLGGLAYLLIFCFYLNPFINITTFFSGSAPLIVFLIFLLIVFIIGGFLGLKYSEKLNLSKKQSTFFGFLLLGGLSYITMLLGDLFSNSITPSVCGSNTCWLSTQIIVWSEVFTNFTAFDILLFIVVLITFITLFKIKTIKKYWLWLNILISIIFFIEGINIFMSVYSYQYLYYYKILAALFFILPSIYVFVGSVLSLKGSKSNS